MIRTIVKMTHFNLENGKWKPEESKTNEYTYTTKTEMESKMFWPQKGLRMYAKTYTKHGFLPTKISITNRELKLKSVWEVKYD